MAGLHDECHSFICAGPDASSGYRPNPITSPRKSFGAKSLKRSVCTKSISDFGFVHMLDVNMKKC